jgi:large repetitive protein
MPTTFWSQERQVNGSGTGSQQQQDVAVLSDGSYVVAYADRQPTTELVRVQRYSPLGEPIGGEISVGTSIASGGPKPEITALPGGAFAVAWMSTSNNISLQKFTAAGAPDGGLIAVATNGFSGGFIKSHDILGLSDGSIAVTYSTGAADVVLKIISSANVVGAEIVVDNAAGLQGTAYLASNGSNLVVTWTDQSVNGGDIQARTFTLTGGSPSAEVTLNAVTAGIQIFSPVTALANGNFAMTWSNSSSGVGIRARIFSPSLAPLGDEFTIALDELGSGPINL